MPVSRKRPSAKRSTTSTMGTSSSPSDLFDSVANPSTDFLRQQNVRLSSKAAKAGLLVQENAKLREQLGRALEELDIAQQVKASPLLPYAIKPKVGKKEAEACFAVAASDWHVEELVRLDMTNGLNAYNLAESQWCATHFFQTAERLFRLYSQDTTITQVVVFVGGDMITNSIHEDCMENNLLGPADAVLRCAEYLVSGFTFLLNTLPKAVPIYVPCHTGNHGRMTRERRVATEPGNSLERLLYHTVAAHFHNQPRITFSISEAYHSYLPVFNSTWRFHHGHNIKYGGGVGGIAVPVNKAIAQWNRAVTADLDIFGHFHQLMDGGYWLSNGSMIGHSPYAVSIKAGFEPPRQHAWLWDRDRGRTFTSPILFPGRMERAKGRRAGR